jgi:hypothetical protein
VTNPDQEVIDLDPPRTQTATSIFPHNVTRFPNYSRVQGAEHHRQSAIARTKKGTPTSSKSSASVLSATVVFYLLTQTQNDDGILIPTSCKALGIVHVQDASANTVLTRGFDQTSREADRVGLIVFII